MGDALLLAAGTVHVWGPPLAMSIAGLLILGLHALAALGEAIG